MRRLKVPRERGIAAADPVPRVISQDQRSPGNGRKRYRLRVDNYKGPVEYVLACNHDDARKTYLETHGLDREEALQRDDKGKLIRPHLVVSELPD